MLASLNDDSSRDGKSRYGTGFRRIERLEADEEHRSESIPGEEGADSVGDTGGETESAGEVGDEAVVGDDGDGERTTVGEPPTAETARETLLKKVDGPGVGSCDLRKRVSERLSVGRDGGATVSIVRWDDSASTSRSQPATSEVTISGRCRSSAR